MEKRLPRALIPSPAVGLPGQFTVKVIVDGQLPIESSPASIHYRTVTVLATLPAPPGANLNAKILVHLRTSLRDDPCGWETIPSCPSIVTAGRFDPNRYFAYVVAAGVYTNGATVSGIAGMKFGIAYDGAAQTGVDILSWAACGTTEVPTAGWPGPGEGNIVTWNRLTRCQREVPDFPAQGASTLAGYFYLAAYSDDFLRVTPHPLDGTATIGDCLLEETVIERTGVPAVPSHLGTAAFSADGEVAGYNPCDTSIPVRPTTWSGIKALYQER